MNKNIARPKLFPRLILMLLLLLAQTCYAQTHIEFVPTLSFSEQYDDNIYLSAYNEISSYITMISPGFSLSFLKQSTQFALEYVPTFVWYSESSIDSTVRHSGTLTFGQELTERLRFDLTDTLLRSDDPLEDTEDVQGARSTREQYWRNNGTASVSYLFGPENTFTAGYRNEYLKNDDELEDDGRTQNPFVTLTYHINVKNCVELDFGYTKADFWAGDLAVAQDDYTGYEPGIRYLYSFNPHSTGILSYNFVTRRFDDNYLAGILVNENYDVHDGSIGFEHSFSPDLSVSAASGYFVRENDISDNDTGYTYEALLTKGFERGNIEIGGSGGWDESYMYSTSRGFATYWSVNTSAEYQILEPLTGYAGGSYRSSEDEDDQKWDITRGNCGLRWDFLRWYSLAVDYTYAERDDDVADSYRDNRISLILTAHRLYRW